MKHFTNIAIIFFTINLVNSVPTDGDKTLQLVQIVWRHGDRSPTTTCPTDPIKEGHWTFGGGGWGQLSPLGMEQHVSLGHKLNEIYVQSGFLSPRYTAKEIYVRSTDVNRTIISAISNFIGMYGQGSSIPGVDCPDLSNKKVNYTWPTGFVPVAVHTVDDDYDYLLNPDMVCPRQTALWKLAQQSKTITTLMNSDDTKHLLNTLTLNCNQTYGLADLWEIQDAFLIERLYNLSNPKFVTEELYQNLTKLNDIAQELVNGIGVEPTNGIDISLETRRIRGGTLLNSISSVMQRKIQCTDKGSGCNWIGNLKYYAYSAHDTTVYAYLTALGAEEAVVKTFTGYPLYSAAAVTELWKDGNGKYFVKLMYHDKMGEGFRPITNMTDSCGGYPLYCPIEEFAKMAVKLSLGKHKTAEELCADNNLFPQKKDDSNGTGVKKSHALTIIAIVFICVAAFPQIIKR